MGLTIVSWKDFCKPDTDSGEWSLPSVIPDCAEGYLRYYHGTCLELSPLIEKEGLVPGRRGSLQSISLVFERCLALGYAAKKANGGVVYVVDLPRLLPSPMKERSNLEASSGITFFYCSIALEYLAARIEIPPDYQYI